MEKTLRLFPRSPMGGGWNPGPGFDSHAALSVTSDEFLPLPDLVPCKRKERASARGLPGSSRGDGGGWKPGGKKAGCARRLHEEAHCFVTEPAPFTAREREGFLSPTGVSRECFGENLISEFSSVLRLTSSSERLAASKADTTVRVCVHTHRG